MNRATIKAAVEKGNIEWQRHALERMMERGIPRDVIKEVLLSGEVIEEYPDDKPFPSALLLGLIEDKPFHVVIAYDVKNEYCFIITAYKPDLDHFEPGFKIRRQLND